MRPSEATLPLLLCALSLSAHGAEAAGETVRYIPAVSCVSGPFALRLPPSLPALLRLGPKLDDKLGDVELYPALTTSRRYLRFDGLILGIITFSDDSARYMLSYAEISHPRWRMVGPYFVGQRSRDAGQDVGSEGGTIRLHHRHGRVTRIDYDCYTG